MSKVSKLVFLHASGFVRSIKSCEILRLLQQVFISFFGSVGDGLSAPHDLLYEYDTRFRMLWAKYIHQHCILCVIRVICFDFEVTEQLKLMQNNAVDDVTPRLRCSVKWESELAAYLFIHSNYQNFFFIF